MGSMRSQSLFVSYSHRDRALVMALLRLQPDLWSAAFIDRLHTPRGTAWWEAHADRIRTADRMPLCWSAHSAESEQVEREWRYALNARTRLIPILLDPTPLPRELTHLHAISLTEFLRATRNSQFLLKQAELFAKSGRAIGVGIATAAIAALSLLVYVRLTTGMPLPFLMLLTVPAVFGSVRLLKFSGAWSRLRDLVHAEVIVALKDEIRGREADGGGPRASMLPARRVEVRDDDVNELLLTTDYRISNDFDADLAVLGQILAKGAAWRRAGAARRRAGIEERRRRARLKAEADARGPMNAPLYDNGRVKCANCKSKVVLQTHRGDRAKRCPLCATKLIAVPLRHFPAQEQFGHAFFDEICTRCGCSIQFVAAFHPPCRAVAAPPPETMNSPTA